MYLLYGLSEDAAAELTKIDMEELLEIGAVDEVNYYFDDIQTEYRGMSVRTWNFSLSSAAGAAEDWKKTAGINGNTVE